MAKKVVLLEYDWRLDGVDAKFCVNEGLYPLAPMENRPLLAYIHFSNAAGQELTSSEVRRVKRLAAKCERRLRTRFAGYIHTAGMWQYYFYISNGTMYSRLKDIADKERKLTLRIGSAAEPDWTTYFKLLYPDTAKLQTVRNAQTIAQLYENGDSTAPRKLNLHIRFENESDRASFVEEARLEGFTIGDTERYADEAQNDLFDRVSHDDPNDGSAEEASSSTDIHTDIHTGCGVVLHSICAMRKRDVDELTVHAIRIAERHGGRLLYWDCQIVPRTGR